MVKFKYLLIITLLSSIFIFLACTNHTQSTISTIEISDTTVIEGESENVTVKINNYGNSDVSSIVLLSKSGRRIDSRKVTIPANGGTKVLFTIDDLFPGTYEISIGDSHGTLSVISLKDLISQSIDAVKEVRSYHMNIEIDTRMAK